MGSGSERGLEHWRPALRRLQLGLFPHSSRRPRRPPAQSLLTPPTSPFPPPTPPLQCVGAAQMAVWAAAKHARLRKVFDGKDGRERYPRRWILLPPFF